MADKKNIPLVRPTLVPWETIEPLFAQVWQSGRLTLGPHTQRFEQAICKVTDAPFAVALSSCTAGLMLLLRAMDIKGEVVLPSFTWASTGHALVWNQVTPVFADCTQNTFTLDPEDVKRKITDRTQAIFASNVFGVQPDMDALKAVADEAGIPLMCDSAQAIGATYKGRKAGSTTYAEVFSLSPTKVVTAVEGGLVTTRDQELAEKLVQMRDYGKINNGMDVEFFGLSARISEFHSIVGAANLAHYKELIESRKKIAEKYHKLLGDVPGISFQEIPDGYESSYNYFVILVDDPEDLHDKLADRGIQSKRYFYPPLHKLTSYMCLDLPEASLPVTDDICSRALALPFYSHMPGDEVFTVAEAVIKFLS